MVKRRHQSASEEGPGEDMETGENRFGGWGEEGVMGIVLLLFTEMFSDESSMPCYIHFHFPVNSLLIPMERFHLECS